MDQGSKTQKSADDWALWFWHQLLPQWLDRVQDNQGGGVFDALAVDGTPQSMAEKSVLAQARTLFSFAHLALLSDDPKFIEAARRQVTFLQHFRKMPGLYRRATDRFGHSSETPADNVARSYDQCFVILGLATWNKLEPSNEIETEIEACWQALSDHLTDPVTGLLLENDSIVDPRAPDAPPRAQNPHMHLYEACLQAYEMSGHQSWLGRAEHIRTIGLRHFFDVETGSLIEFTAPDLGALPDALGARREPGHQYEWAWLLLREAELAGTTQTLRTAEHLIQFADRFGRASAPRLQGAAYDALWGDGRVMENSFLLWPQTEAIKTYAVRHTAGVPNQQEWARGLLCLMFEHWFEGHPFWINHIDPSGAVIGAETFTRLFYHLVLALSEGARAGLWPDIRPLHLH